MPRFFTILLVTLCGVAASAGGAPAWGQPTGPLSFWEGAMRFGDDPRWADPAYDDGDWPTKRLYPAPDTQGVHWVRVPVRVEPTLSQNGPVGIHLSMLSAVEVYWDGVQIGQNGRVGHSRAQERPGTMEYLAHVPDSLYTSGEHLLALRLSNYHMPRDFEYYLYSLELGPYRAFQEGALSELLPLLFLGAFVLVMLYCGVLYALDRRRPIGIFGLLCGAVALLLALESARELAQYTYDWHPVRIDAITALTAAVGALLPWFFAEQFEVPRRPLVMGSVGAGLSFAFLVPDAADFKAYWMYWTALVVSLGITGWAVLQQKRGAWMAILGVGACIGTLLAFDRQFAYRYFFPSFALVVAAVLATLAQRARERERERQKAELTATRLEVQLLKKHLQPHFLMNTLTAAIEWLESDPEVGARFIKALAEELRLLSDISDQPAIPLRRELHLCRLHLQVMGFRQDRTFQLHVEDVDEEALVPPATFHTLLENAITHNRYGESEIVFRLQGEALGGGRRYVLVAPLSADPPGVSSNRPSDNGSSDNGSSDNAPSGAEGTGLRYVKACLREQYGTGWAVRSGPETSEAGPPVWRTTIDIYDDK